MRFVIYKGIIISVFCKGTFMSGALCKMLFSPSFAECDLSEKCSPIPESLRLLRHSTHCSSADRSSADGGAFQLALDTKSNWPHLRQVVTTLFGLECPLLFIMCIFYSASNMFPYWLLPFAFWCEQLVCGAEQEQQWGFCSLIIRFIHAFSVEQIILCPAKSHNCSCCGR